MAQKNTKRKTSTTTTRSKSKVSKSGFGRVVPNKWVAVIFIAIIAGLGSYFVFFSQAAPLNCQNDGTVPVCDVDMVSGDTDTILSMGTEAKDLGAKKWGLYFPATFRAPVKQLRGSVPVYRVYNKAATYHDWVVDTEKATKDAKYDIEVQGTPFHAWKTQVEGTVPVYRITRGENHSQAIFSTDRAWVEKMLALGKNDPKGWKRDVFGKFVAFYAYPPNYKVANQVNPYDCSIAANFTSDRCTTQRESLEKAVESGTVPKTSACPTTLKAYLDAPFNSQFDGACQAKWNAYAQDCSKQENFYTDRCATARQTLEEAYDCSKQENFLSNRCEQERAQLQAAYDCTKQENFLSDRCAKARNDFANAAAARTKNGTGNWTGNSSVPPQGGARLSYWKKLSDLRVWCGAQFKGVDPVNLRCAGGISGISRNAPNSNRTYRCYYTRLVFRGFIYNKPLMSRETVTTYVKAPKLSTAVLYCSQVAVRTGGTFVRVR